MADAPLIELVNVSHAYFMDRRKTTAKVVLKDMSLTIAQGEFVSLVGPSGCGKTVTLSIMAGFEKPVRGEALFEGHRIEGPSPKRGVVFQEYSLLPWLSAKDNIVFALRNSAKARKAPFDKQEASKRAVEALAQVGLEDSADTRPNTLSGGMKQRVAIARLLAMDSEVLLMDEPFSALDEQTRNALDVGIHRIWKEKRKTIVFVTHDITEAVRISSRIVMLSDTPGTVIGEWTMPEGLDREAGSPEMNGLVAEIRAALPRSSLEL